MIIERMPKAKAVLSRTTDIDMLKRGEQKGLDTPVVRAVNDED